MKSLFLSICSPTSKPTFHHFTFAMLLFCAANTAFAQPNSLGINLNDKVLPLELEENSILKSLGNKNLQQNFFVFQIHDSPPYFIAVHLTEKVDKHSSNKASIKYDAQLAVGLQNTLHGVKVVGSSSDSNDFTYDWSIYDAHASTQYKYQHLSFKPTVDSLTAKPVKGFELQQATLTVNCEQEVNGVTNKVKKEVVSLPQQEAKKLLEQAQYYKAIFNTHKPDRLFRDDWGVYYYIEENKNPDQGQRYRLWMGYRRAMKRIPVITAAVDTEGIVLVSKDAAIRLVAKHSTRTNSSSSENFGAYWTEGNKQKVLLEVPTDRNQGLIFNELGIYDSLYLGSFCDPLFSRSPLILEKLIKLSGLQKH